MSEPIDRPEYWRKRLHDADDRHHAIFRCPLDRWQRIEDKHRSILARHIRPGDSVLDAGCGWGRLLSLMPSFWHGRYLGVDLSPDFVALADTEHPQHLFSVADLRDLSHIRTPFHWAVLISVRPMVRRNMGEAEWGKMERELRRVASRLLFLEYDETDEGNVEGNP